MKQAELTTIKRAETLLVLALDVIDQRKGGEPLPEEADALIEVAAVLLRKLFEETTIDDA